MLNLDRYNIDDGDHRPKYIIDEDASAKAGQARFRAACSCKRMPDLPAGTREEALAAHIAHVNTKLGPTKGPKWLPESARLAILLVAMVAIWIGCYAVGEMLADDFTGVAAKMVVLGSVLTGFALAFGLMVATRHYIAPTRA
ncbi:hypothetical protein ABT282_08025 [Streptomyces sp. NPDC000927]|uniref:hypothetical protein n=1 Tax=Streptomyces sp. NPDC000927 TaxID=3154371 RepID=UPI00331BA1C7